MTKPTIGERARQHLCPECGASVERAFKTGRRPVFCSPEHKRSHNTRALVDGRAVIAYIKAWRIDRGSGPIAKESFARICAIVDSMNEEDRKAGRARADLYAAILLDGNDQPVHDLRYGRRKIAEGLRRKEREAEEQAA